jgi:hypothetical protein
MGHDHSDDQMDGEVVPTRQRSGCPPPDEALAAEGLGWESNRYPLRQYERLFFAVLA